ncbi:MAG: nucleotidyltransferase family protein [Acidobacteriota bacterium]
MNDPKRFLIAPAESIREAMIRIDRNGKGIVVAIDSEARLLGTITDGDIRRAILLGVDLDDACSALLTDRGAPVTAPAGTNDVRLLELMSERGVRQIPLVDEGGHVVDVVVMNDILSDRELPVRAVVMAGGFGSRLGQLTETTPKPMLPVGDRPLLEQIIENFRQAGIRNVNVTTHFQSDVISDHFGDGTNFGVHINYVREDRPLGTAGALGLIAESGEPILVINGDIVTRVDFHSMLKFHREHRADMTVAVRQCEFHIPYGVVQCDGPLVTSIAEKPAIRQLVNAGIYLLNPDVPRLVPGGQRFDMPDLIGALLAAKRRVASFPVTEYWLDIGQLSDYERAKEDARR